MTKQLLVEYHADFGRMGDLQGLFVCTEDELKAAMGESVYWGEVLGKHSEIDHDLSDDDITIKSEDQDFIAKLVDLLGTDISGFNPVSKIQEQQRERE